ncbi:MAG: IS66 family transposase, partial [Hyphomicrobiaceae bacterium]|nr:IS66 family transposase [Hyphomicrobiaceae bacterium]
MEPTREQTYLRRHAELEAENAGLRRQNAQLLAQVDRLTQQVAKLTEQVARLSKNSSNSSKPPSSDIVKPPKPTDAKGPRTQGGQPGHKGVTRRPFRDDQIDRLEELHPTDCPHCHSASLEPTGRFKSQQVAELREKPLRITEYRLYGYRCATCGKLVWASLPHGVAEGQLFDPRLQALIAYMKGALHASYTGLADFCRDVLGIEVARSLLCNTIARVNDALAQPYEQLAEHLPAEPVLNVDESGWKNKGIRYWIWVFCTSTFSFFRIARSGGSQVLEAVLGEVYGGTIISDFFSAYVKYANRLQQFCLAHLIRDLKYLTTLCNKKTVAYGKLLLDEMRKLFGIIHRRAKMGKNAFRKALCDQRRTIIDIAIRGAPDTRHSQNMAKRFEKHGAAYFQFITMPGL